MTLNDNTPCVTQAQEAECSYRYQSPPSGLNLNLEQFAPEFEEPSDHLSPETTWTTPNQSPLTDLESPLSSYASAGIHQDVSWNPFDYSFASIQSSIDNGTFMSRNPFHTATGPPNTFQVQNGYSNCNKNSYVNLSSIDESPHFDYQLENEDQDRTLRLPLSHEGQTPINSPLPSSGVTIPIRTQSKSRSRQPAWGQPRSRRNSISTPASRSQNHEKKRRKSIDQTTPPARLRSTASSNYRAEMSSCTFSAMNSRGEERGSNPKSRSNHNQVEKQYRNRLNSQFELLLSTLPKEELPSSSSSNCPEMSRGDEYGEGETDAMRRVSKAEVLVLAERHIKRLERESQELEEDNADLKARVGELKRVWVERGGVIMP